MKKSRLLGAVCAFTLSFCSLSVYAVAVSGQGTWETTLLPRDLDGDNTTAEAYYDTVLGITWLADANLAASSTFGITGIDPIYGMSWDDAQSWISAMNAANYLGNTDWRLPMLQPADGISFNYNESYDGSTDLGNKITRPTAELAYLFHVTLGNPAIFNTNGSDSGCFVAPNFCLQNTGPFVNLAPKYYWYGLESDTYSSHSWIVSFLSGYQLIEFKNVPELAWAVHDGDIGAAVIPIPPALWLFGSGLLGLIGIARRRMS